MTQRSKIRIIGGEYRSRLIDVIDSQGLRPTSSRMRETLFNWLQTDIVGTLFIDLFAGTGALGIEALSRGADQSYFIEKDRQVFQQLKRNIENLTIDPKRYQLIQMDSIQWLKKNAHKDHLSSHSSKRLTLFIDPPFEEPALYEALSQALEGSLLIQQCTDLIIEMPIKSHLQSKMAFIESFKLSRELSTKESSLHYYRKP